MLKNKKVIIIVLIILMIFFNNYVWADDEEELKECIEGFYEDNNFLKIEKVVCERLGAKKIVVDDWYGYVDHQSYMSIPEFLEEYNVSIEDFIFGKYEMIIDNDNH